MEDVPAAVGEEVLDDLRRRLRATRWLDGVRGGWERGTERGYLADLVADWADWTEADGWRSAEARLRGLPWVATAAGLRAVEQRAAEPGADVVLLLHGWPDSFLRFQRVLPLLTDLHVVVPCLPGFPYSGAPGSSTAAMVEPVAAMMAELGHDRYVASGGDIGSRVVEGLARAHPDRVAAVHLTDLPLNHVLAVDPDQRTPAERDYLVTLEEWRTQEGGYIAEQATKPNTLAVGLADSPAGMAAWIVEKLRSWSDCDGHLDTVFPRTELLTWLTLSWVTGTIGTSFVPYAEREPVVPGRVEVPTVMSLFAHDLLPPPRELAERAFDVRVWDEQPRGGHFAAWERPEAFVQGLRLALGLTRPAGP
jgi:pimeloyl-ACP methyl ester carboxylesterase